MKKQSFVTKLQGFYHDSSTVLLHADGYDPGVPGLVVHRPVDYPNHRQAENGWDVSHTKSGLSVIPLHLIFGSRKQAVFFARSIGNLADWTQDGDKILEKGSLLYSAVCIAFQNAQMYEIVQGEQ